MKKGRVINIQRFSTGDGPGIRTTVFFKGCPLSCKWCHNPESQSAESQLCYYKEKCMLCGVCESVCEYGVFHVADTSNIIDHKLCRGCGKCVESCPGNALDVFGCEYTAKEIIEAGCRDIAYYGENGGVTLSGGEPCMQWEFALSVLKGLKEHGIKTALDTSGFCKWEHMEPLMPFTDMLLYDIKHMDDQRHKELTGVGNELILGNLRAVLEQGKSVLIRCVVIPGENDEETNWRALADFLRPYPQTEIELLAYHTYGISKYAAIGKEYELNGCVPPTADKMKELAGRLRKYGVNCFHIIGGKRF